MYSKCLVFFSLFISLVFSQAPQGINYQAVVRDADGILYENENLTIIFKIIVLETGNLCWEEEHQIQTNDFGLFTTIIGQGESTSSGSFSSFSDLDWTEGTMYITVDIDFDNEGPQPPIDFGETQLLSVPYALFSNSSGNQKWEENDNTISLINPDVQLDINSSSAINMNSDNINVGSENATLNFHYNQMNFLNEGTTFLSLDDEFLNIDGRITSLEPLAPNHLSTKNYVDTQDDDIVLQMNSAFEENINFFQSQIDSITIDVSSLQENVNENSIAYFTLQDILYINDENLQDQIDILNQVLQSLEININTNIDLQNQLEGIQNEVSNLSDIVQQIQQSISQE